MGIWDTYENRVYVQGKTKREAALFRTSRRLSEKLGDSLSYHDVLVDGEERSVIIDDSDNLNEKIMHSLPGEDFICGSLVEWADNHSSPQMMPDGTHAISQANDNIVWKALFNILETRMKNGEFTVIDATNSKTSEMNRYKKMCDEYRYRIYCVDMTTVPIEVTKERNRGRQELKRVPEEVIDKMYARFETQKIPSGIKVIQPDELNAVFMKKFNLDQYKRIHHIGDIHGCNTALNTYFEANGGFKDDEFYIFCGDYTDRGIENADVLKFLLSTYDKPNVLLLEGNHERWLWDWAHDKVTASKEFEFHTKAEIEAAGIDKKSIRKLYRRMGQCAYYEFRGKTAI